MTTDPRTAEQIAQGWLPHDGGPCPVALDSKPGVMFAEHPGIDAGLHCASEWTHPHYDFWRHQGRKDFAIVAYLPDPEHPDTLKARIAELEAGLTEKEVIIEGIANQAREVLRRAGIEVEQSK